VAAERLRRVVDTLPQGRVLDEAVWEGRHRGICRLLIVLALPLLVFGVAQGHGAWHSLSEAAVIAAAGVTARSNCGSRGLRSAVATLGLFGAAQVLVHFSDGSIEAHFAFFVAVGIITLYQDWLPFLLGIAFTVAIHGVVGVLLADAVYDHHAAQANPWLWAAIHGGFVLAASASHVVAWRLNERTALRDGLTSLANRTMLADRIDQALTRRARSGGDLAILVLDLDGFKAVNDSLGHAMGDRLLVEVGERLGSSVRGFDIAARLGGDEFAVVLEGAGEAGAVLAAARLLDELARPVVLDGRQVQLTASIGIALANRTADTQDVLLRNADLAMYMAKAAGKGRSAVYRSGMHAEVVARAQLEAELRDGIAAGELVLYYQPTVVLGTGDVSGVEALVRWQHPTHGLMYPDQFIPLAEESGLVVPLGRWVLQEACRQGRVWQEDGPLTIAVNVSARQLADDSFVAEVAGILDETGLPATTLVLELTETILMLDVDRVVPRLEALRALGVRLAIDDFGTGYSSLSYLRHFPVDIIKIDRSFVAELPAGETSLAATILRLGQSLDLEVIAEGIEEEVQAQALGDLDCVLGQGYLYARPMPAADTDLSRRATAPRP
jgi:diguanylate cyclase (GGDEF)-like protein